MSGRYYDAKESEDEIRPGKISQELRQALNLPENDVPIWIYRMRALGYPPGWLKKAIVDTSDIFDTDSLSDKPETNKRKCPSEDEVQYDHSKLIEFPGFNTPMPEGCNDYHYYLNMPAMLEHQQLEYAKKYMNAFKPAQIPKRIRVADDSNKTLDDSVSSTTSSTHKNLNSSINSDEISVNETKSADVSINGDIKLLYKGSPMPKPLQRAPLEKFSEGVVGELLYFENIPNQTGKFETIRGLLKSIRGQKSEEKNEEKDVGNGEDKDVEKSEEKNVEESEENTKHEESTNK